jgi:hypothetical protein
MTAGCALFSCATGAPVGSRAWSVDGYAPFAREGTPRDIPPREPLRAEPTTLPVESNARESVLTTAKSLVGKSKLVVNGKRYGDDCTGFIRALFESLGLDLMSAAMQGDNGVTAMWRFATRHGRIFDDGTPVPGDLVFFKETYDLNRDGNANDGLTHIGIVETVETDETVVVIHRVARGVVRYRMNLRQPTAVKTATGRILNDWLRTERPGSKPRLTAELFAGYATLLPATP